MLLLYDEIEIIVGFEYENLVKLNRGREIVC